jgi:biopolymer transport protein ExbD
MINIKGTKDYLVALESVAMTDIVLNMFIFFFISFSLLYTFNKAVSVEVNLPASKSLVKLDGADKVILTVTREGRYYLDAQPVTVKEMKSLLRARLGKEPSLEMVLMVDRVARFNNVVMALDIINELGIRRLSVAATRSK